MNQVPTVPSKSKVYVHTSTSLTKRRGTGTKEEKETGPRKETTERSTSIDGDNIGCELSCVARRWGPYGHAVHMWCVHDGPGREGRVGGLRKEKMAGGKDGCGLDNGPEWPCAR